ncbi:sensor histidine kinase [Anaerocellum danielii]|uniref:histidine kinase n=1 Tax=Anaerocellum danielii TaxID=1387557 RepID=A0ABZ0U2Q6_9FIRM|nr:histidine kinase [Caldicellulosiruptor danielii]WPX08729.1 histidine kinase [Caldicellulosiruptor danielii]
MLSFIISVYTLWSLYENGKISKIAILFLLLFLSLEFLKTEYLKSIYHTAAAVFAELIIIFFAIFLCRWEFFFLIPTTVCTFLQHKNKLSIYSIASILFISLFLIPPKMVREYVFVCVFVFSLKLAIQMLQDSKNEYLEKIDHLRLLNLQLSKLKTQLLESQQTIERLAAQNQQMKIATSLHDTVGHNLAALNIQLNAIKSLLEKKGVLKDAQISQIISSCLQQTQISYESLRKFVYSMKNSFETKEKYLSQLIENFNFCNITLNRIGDIENIPSHVFENLMAILKEALLNVAKHSDATQVAVSLESKPTYVRLAVHDNGKKKGEIKEGVGLMSIKLRAKSMGSTVNIDNHAGFSIVVFVPLKSRREDYFEKTQGLNC